MRKETRSKERLARRRRKNRAFIASRSTPSTNPKLELIMYPGKIAEAKTKGDIKIAPEVAPDADDDSDPDSDLAKGDDGNVRAIDPGTRRNAQHPQRPGPLSAGPKTASNAHEFVRRFSPFSGGTGPCSQADAGSLFRFVAHKGQEREINHRLARDGLLYSRP